MLKGLDEWMFGDFRANRQRTEERHTADMKRIQALLDSQEGQTLLMKARAASLDRGEGYYGGRGVDPYVKGSEDLGKIRAARDKFTEEELTPQTSAYFDAAEKSVLDRMKSTPTRDNREYFAPGGELDVFDEMGGKQKAPKGELDVFEALGKKKKKTFPGGKGGTFRGRGATGGWPEIGEYFQAPTETVPESNIPKTYPQMGIESVDDMATLQDMQKALPDVDMRQEYESDPEMMQKLMELWRAKKLNKSNLHKAFSTIQQSAQQALGIR